VKTNNSLGSLVGAIGASCAVLGVGLAAGAGWIDEVRASGPDQVCCPSLEAGPPCGDWAGTWYWLRSPEQEKRVVASLYNRYCIRCHGVDGRGVWDIPDVPNFTSAGWQASRSDAQLARAILEGRGAVMPAFRGTLTLEESWALARYLRSFVPGSEASRPADPDPKKSDEELPAPRPAGPAVKPANSPNLPSPRPAESAPRPMPTGQAGRPVPGPGPVLQPMTYPPVGLPGAGANR
jgi:hypothetical protein